MDDVDITLNDLKTLNQIVDFCRNIQARYSESSHLYLERRKFQKTLIDLCRRCKDTTCPEGCEVKKAFRTTLL